MAIRCLKMKKSCSTQNLLHHIELIAKLRHRHLVSVLGHCFECYLDDSTVSRMFFVFEYVPNGELRSWISGMTLKHDVVRTYTENKDHHICLVCVQMGMWEDCLLGSNA